MPAIDPHNFLLALATYLAERTELEHEGTPRALWAGPAAEADCPQLEDGRVGTYTELRTYDGSVEFIGVATAAIQARTVGHLDADAWAQAAAVANGLLDAQGRPLRMLGLTGFRLIGVLNLRGPSFVERDDKGRAVIVTNLDAKYIPLTGETNG